MLKIGALISPFKVSQTANVGHVAGVSHLAVINGVFKQLHQPKSVASKRLQRSNSSPSFSRQHVAAMRKMHLQVGIRALKGSGRTKEAKTFENMLERDEELNSDMSLEANRSELLAALTLKKEIIATLAADLKQQGLSNKDAKREAMVIFNQHNKQNLNEANWSQIKQDFNFTNHKFSSVLVPAGQLKLGETDIFSQGYNNSGVCSKSGDEITHAVNLWTTAFNTHDGKTSIALFQGLRHGVLSPYELKANSSERAAGALSRAREVVTAALFQQPEKLERALAGQTVDLPMTSCSLLTPVNIGPSTEKSQLDDQIAAWNALSAGPVTLSIRNKEGTLVPVTVKPAIAAFNFGVNELALGMLKLGHTHSDKINKQALHQLLGSNLLPNAPLGGWVGNYLASQPANADRVRQLGTELKEIWASKSHHYDEGGAYKAPLRVALLSAEIGITPCWNCKSGKDRTGMMDSLIKHETASHYLGISSRQNPQADGQRQKLLQNIMLNSGNLEVQQYNTGVPGNKTLKENKLVNMLIGGLSLRDQIGDRAISDLAKGLSDYV